MSKPDMTGRKDLGVQRLPPTAAIPKQSKTPTRTVGTKVKGKMKKAMKQAKMANC